MSSSPASRDPDYDASLATIADNIAQLSPNDVVRILLKHRDCVAIARAVLTECSLCSKFGDDILAHMLSFVDPRVANLASTCTRFG